MDLNKLHEWLNDERVEVFWQEKGSIEDHAKFIKAREEDEHTLAVIGSYVSINVEGEPLEPVQATYAEVRPPLPPSLPS